MKKVNVYLEDIERQLNNDFTTLEFKKDFLKLGITTICKENLYEFRGNYSNTIDWVFIFNKETVYYEQVCENGGYFEDVGYAFTSFNFENANLEQLYIILGEFRLRIYEEEKRRKEKYELDALKTTVWHLKAIRDTGVNFQINSCSPYDYEHSLDFYFIFNKKEFYVELEEYSDYIYISDLINYLERKIKEMEEA